MSDNEDFWEDLLSHIRHKALVPVVGPELSVVSVGDTEQTLTTLIGQRLAERFQLKVSPGNLTMDEAVAAVLQKRGRDELERLYRIIYDTITELDPAPCEALRDLAAIDDLRLFVSTTPDRLLAQALSEVRFNNASGPRELSFSPNQCTSEQSRNLQPAEGSETVVLNLFGQAASTPQYAIHEEDQLEWLHALLSEGASLPDWLSNLLKRHPMLFIGCEIPDWLGRFMLRMSSNLRLSLEREQQFFFVGELPSYEPSLSKFFATYCRKTLVQHLDMKPAKFVGELRERWEQQTKLRPAPGTIGSSAGLGLESGSAPDAETIFISYMREDADAARRLYAAITKLGGDVWMDEPRIRPGDAWEPEVLRSIRRTVRLFIPVISANTEAAREGYVFREWNEAVNRLRGIMGQRFVVPVVVDTGYDGDASRYQNIPEEFGGLHFGRAPAGAPDEGLIDMLTGEIRAMRRTDAA